LLTNVAIRHLVAFIALAEELHFARAAERLHVTQPALSQTLRQLEAEVGVRLVIRTTRRVALSPEGALFLPSAQAAVEAFEAAIGGVRRLAAGELGHLRVGYTIGAAVDLVPEILRQFGQRYADVELELAEYDFGRPAAGLDGGAVDVAIMRPPIDVEDVVFRELLQEPRVACMPSSHRLAERDAVSVREVLGEPIIAAPGGGVWRDYWICAEYRDEPARVVSEAATFEAELQQVAAGRGISITAMAAANFYSRPGVAFVPIEDIPPCVVAVAHRPDPKPAVERFVAVAVEVATRAQEARRAAGTAGRR
jgi:DNA-binding transcriptional LysR family regulator